MPDPDPHAQRALQLLAEHGQRVDDFLKRELDRRVDAPPRLIEAIAYSLFAGGKRLRPTLVLESFVACGGSDWNAALPAAAAIELIHTFSLVHDDLPAMDDDDLRRGRPTSHRVFGEAMAILAGDAMVTLAFEVLAECAPAPLAPLLIKELASASGPAGMIGGQVLDIEGEGKSLAIADLQDLHRRKTGALLRAAVRMGALCASADAAQLDAMTDFGTHIGLAFQIVDDILDVTSTPEQLGKATGKDAARGKNTYPSLLGLEASRAQAASLLDQAIHALALWGDAAAGLSSLARFILARTA